VNEPALINSPEVTVSQLSAALKRTVEEAYGFVRVRGEISGYRGPHSSGHAYFALKDEGAKIDAVVWKGVFGRMRFKPQEGLEVVATGRLTTYPGRSSYQIVIETLEPAGVGALMALLEERKKKLAAEGLFDEARKQLLPFLPEVIGVVTSPTGAVIRDILHRLEDRFPRRVLVWPVRVQGEGAAAEVAAAIQGFNALEPGGRIPRPDLVIVARGGGSLEDLWAFNEEVVVRAAAESMIPLISAVGHETDITLIDFASDRRAPTPTAAAEMAVPVRSELMAQVDGLARRGRTCWIQHQERRRTDLRGLARALPTADRLLGERRQRLDGAAARLLRGLSANNTIHGRQLDRVAARLVAQAPKAHLERMRQQIAKLDQRIGFAQRRMFERPKERFESFAKRLASAMRTNRDAHVEGLKRAREKVEGLSDRAERAMRTLLDRQQRSLDRAQGLLSALSYQGVLARGYALVRDEAGRPLRAAAMVRAGARLDIEFTDGHVAAITAGDDGAPSSADASTPAAESLVKTRRRRASGSSGQGSLFGG
jgi:exodeoxyribonuclease VII large subunit